MLPSSFEPSAVASSASTTLASVGGDAVSLSPGKPGGSDENSAALAGTMVQYLRWHCRIKVGHTKSLAVFADDLLMRRPFLELEQAASFAGLKPDRRSLVEVLEVNMAH